MNGVKDTLVGIRDKVKKPGLKNRSSYYRQTKSGQKERFMRCRQRFPELISSLSQHDISRYVNPNWTGFSSELQKALLPYPDSAFLRNKIIMDTMFVSAGGNWLEEELQFLDRKLSRDVLKAVLVEDWVGDPVLMNREYNSSHNSIHTLYHLAKYVDSTKNDLHKINSVVEWGGGYGCMTKTLRRFVSGPLTHVIIDLPMMSSIQWLYLSSILGEENVNLILGKDQQVKPGMTNLLPVCFIDDFDIRGDLFISTWALSESAEYAQDYVAKRKWFDSKHLLLAFQSGQEMFPGAAKVGALATASGAKTERIPFIGVGYDNYYAFL